MLSTEYRKRLQFICSRIAQGAEVSLEDITWAQKLANANTTARTWLQQARKASEGEAPEGGLDEFLNTLGLAAHGEEGEGIRRFETVDEIVAWFKRDKPKDWRQHD